MLEMTLEGGFRDPPQPPLLSKIIAWAILVAVLAGCAVVALLALWVAAVIIPVALGAAVVAWGLWRYRVWRAGG